MSIINTKLGGTDATDGDVLKAEDLNDTFDTTVNMGKWSGPLGPSGGRNFNIYNHAFGSDDASVKTNFTYTTPDNTYTVLGTSAGVLETEVVNSTGFNFGSPISKAFMKWNYYIFTVYDETDDSSVDGTLWDFIDTGSVNASQDEDGARLRSRDSSAGSGTLSIITKRNFYNTNDIMIIRASVFVGNETSNTSEIQITNADASVDVDIHTLVINTPNNDRYMFIFDATNNQVFVFEGNTPFPSSPFDLSSLGTSWRIRFLSNANNPNTIDAYVLIKYARRITGSETSTVVESFSSNNGSNYATTANVMASIPSANRSFRMKAKLTSTPASGEGVNVHRIDFQGFTEND